MKDQLLAKHQECSNVICYPWTNTGQKTTMVKTFSSSLTFAALWMWEYMGGMIHPSHPHNIVFSLWYEPFCFSARLDASWEGKVVC